MSYRPRLKMMSVAVANAVGFQRPRRLAVPWHIVFRVWGGRRP